MSDEVKLEGKMKEFVDWIETISVLELSQLVKALEDRLGVSAAAPMAMAARPSVRASTCCTYPASEAMIWAVQPATGRTHGLRVHSASPP